ncbi:hypothetical protein HDU67_001541 [Dinochytrium kinnereticum]|nr:hypothetical protein HDU67_001541 [Dinochytrium kinnereticum]
MTLKPMPVFPELTEFVEIVALESRAGIYALAVTWIFLERLKERLPTGAKVSLKLLSDAPVTSRQFLSRVHIPHCTTRELNLMERQFLFLMGFRLEVSEHDVCKRVGGLLTNEPDEDRFEKGRDIIIKDEQTRYSPMQAVSAGGRWSLGTTGTPTAKDDAMISRSWNARAAFQRTLSSSAVSWEVKCDVESSAETVRPPSVVRPGAVAFSMGSDFIGSPAFSLAPGGKAYPTALSLLAMARSSQGSSNRVRLPMECTTPTSKSDVFHHQRHR